MLTKPLAGASWRLLVLNRFKADPASAAKGLTMAGIGSAATRKVMDGGGATGIATHQREADLALDVSRRLAAAAKLLTQSSTPTAVP